MSKALVSHLGKQLAEIRAAGLYKGERVITSPQNARIRVADGREVLKPVTRIPRGEATGVSPLRSGDIPVATSRGAARKR